MANPSHAFRWCRPWLLCLTSWALGLTTVSAQTHRDPLPDANRLTYLDAALDPYYPHRHFPKLATPQWIGEPGVEAVVVLAIDDMRDSAQYENYLRPILDRLKAIDGRAAVSIMTNRATPEEPQLKSWLEEGVSIEVHTFDHPCPCLQGGDFAKAKETYDRCVDLMFDIPGNHPVAYRMPCCDSLNTPSPRFWAEVLHRTTPQGHFLTMDSSVFQIFTPADPDIPGDWLIDEDGERTFRKYLPFPSFVNTIEDYPYPYVIGRMSWQFPCMVPSDWEAQNIQQPFNPRTVRDMQKALDITVLKQGVFNLVFHPHGWIRNDQVVQLIDHAVEQHGDKVKFLTFREAQERIDQHLLGGASLRTPRGHDAGVRLLDLNHDGYLDVVIGDEDNRKTRIWQPETQSWRETSFPFTIVAGESFGSPAYAQVRFGVDSHNRVACIGRDAQDRWQAVVWMEDGWQSHLGWQRELNERVLGDWTDNETLDGIYLRDVDQQGGCELLVGRGERRDVFRCDPQLGWQRLPWQLPAEAELAWGEHGDHGVRFVDLDGDADDDLVISNERHFAVYRFTDADLGWSERLRHGRRGDAHPVPMIARDGTNNGAWFHSDHLWIQNEGTNRLPDLVERMSFAELLQSPEELAQEPREPDPTDSPSDSTVPQPEPETSGELSQEEVNLRDRFPQPLPPEAALRTLKTHPNLAIELVAAEPLIADPVAFDWDHEGRLWVVEMGDYPRGRSEHEPTVRLPSQQDQRQRRGSGRLRMLVDSDRDGRYDTSQIVLDDLNYPTAVKTWRDGVLVLAPPELVKVELDPKSGRATQVDVLFRGFAEGNQQHRANGLRWGLDGWLYVANGDSGGTIESLQTGEQVQLRGLDLKLHPDSGQLEPLSGQTQFGRNRNDWGDWFGGNNSYPVWHYVLEDRYLRRNPHIATPPTRRHVPQRDGNAPVFPLSVTLERFNDLHTANRITSACSPMIYRGTQLGDAYFGNSFVCEPVHNLVHREVVSRDGVSFTSQRANDEQRSEFLASTDSWFRPVMLRTGPDGGLWVADMYRLVIEHPEWIPADWQARLNLRAGDDRGRIYRVHAQDAADAEEAALLPANAAEWVARLAAASGTARDQAQQWLTHHRSLHEDASLQNAVRRLAREADRPQVRLQALWTLETGRVLQPSDLVAASQDPHAMVVRGSIQIWERHFGDKVSGEDSLSGEASGEVPWQVSPAQLQVWIAVADAHPATRLQLACSLGELTSQADLPTETRQLATHWLAQQFMDHSEPLLVAAVLSSIHADNLNGIWEALRESQESCPPASFAALVQTSLALERYEPLIATLKELAEVPAQELPQSQWQRVASLVAALDKAGLNATQHDADSSDAGRLHWADIRAKWFTRAQALLGSSDADAGLRAITVQVLAHTLPEADASNAWQSIAARLDVREPLEVQRAALQTLATQGPPPAGKWLVERWSHMTPSLRNEVVGHVLSRTDWTLSLLDAIAQEKIVPQELATARWQQLRNHRNELIRERVSELPIENVSSNRQAVMEAYEVVHEMEGNVAQGQSLFKKSCANCHQLAGIGQAVGPDLTALTDRSLGALLTAVLDPNRAVEDKYLDYVVVTEAGRQYTGMLLDESSVSLTLVDTEGRQRQLLRSDILEMASSGKSLMPEGLEKELNPQQLADVLAFVRSQTRPPKSFAGNHPVLVEIDAEGAYELTAKVARIYGPSLVFESQYENLGWWSSEEDYAAWDVQVDKAGTYEIIFEYAADASAAGDRAILQIGEQRLSATVASTGTWDDYQVRKVGRIELTPGRYEVTLRSAGPIRSALIDLRAIRLYPYLLD